MWIYCLGYACFASFCTTFVTNSLCSPSYLNNWYLLKNSVCSPTLGPRHNQGDRLADDFLHVRLFSLSHVFYMLYIMFYTDSNLHWQGKLRHTIIVNHWQLPLARSTSHLLIIEGLWEDKTPFSLKHILENISNIVTHFLLD